MVTLDSRDFAVRESGGNRNDSATRRQPIRRRAARALATAALWLALLCFACSAAEAKAPAKDLSADLPYPCALIKFYRFHVYKGKSDKQVEAAGKAQGFTATPKQKAAIRQCLTTKK
jgi:hypothetical protein